MFVAFEVSPRRLDYRLRRSVPGYSSFWRLRRHFVGWLRRPASLRNRPSADAAVRRCGEADGTYGGIGRFEKSHLFFIERSRVEVPRMDFHLKIVNNI